MHIVFHVTFRVVHDLVNVVLIREPGMRVLIAVQFGSRRDLIFHERLDLNGLFTRTRIVFAKPTSDSGCADQYGVTLFTQTIS